MIRRPAFPNILVVVLVCLYAVGFGLMAAQAHPAHETGAFDLGVYDQALWNAARGSGLRLTLVPELGPTRFAIHVEPSLFLIVPLYRFFTDDPRLLLWLQALVIALGGIPLYRLARRRLANDWAALAIVAVYFLLPALESVTLFDFHGVGLAPTLLITALYFLDLALVREDDPRGLWIGQVTASPGAGRTDGNSQILYWVLAGLFFLLALGTKEDIAPLVFMVGLYVLILRRRWWPGLVLMLVGLAWFFIAVSVVIPAHRPGGASSAYVNWLTDRLTLLGDTPLEIALSPFRTPGKVVALLLTTDNIRALGMLTLPLALMPLIGLPFFVLAAPSLAFILLSSNPLTHQLETYHYAAPIIPFVILAAVDGIGRLSSLKPANQESPKADGADSHGSGRSIPYSFLLSPVFLSFLVLIASLVYHYYRGFSPLARPFHWPMVSSHQSLGDELAASIPPGVPVIAQAELVPQLSHRPWIQVWQGHFDEPAEYLFLDVSHPAFVNRDGAQEFLVSGIALDPEVGPILTQDGYLVLQRTAPRHPTTPEFFTFVYADPPATATPVTATFGQELELVAFETDRNYADREGEPLITLYWHVLSPPKEDYFIAVFLLDESGNPVGVTDYQQPLTVWWPTSRWEPERIVRLLANTFPWWTGDRRRFGYGVAVVRGRDAWDVSSRLPVNRNDGGPAPLDSGTLLPLTGFQRVAGIPYSVPFFIPNLPAETDDAR